MDKHPGNIHWKDLPKNAQIKLENLIYKFQNKTIFWHSNEDIEAQGFLNRCLVQNYYSSLKVRGNHKLKLKN